MFLFGKKLSEDALDVAECITGGVCHSVTDLSLDVFGSCTLDNRDKVRNALKELDKHFGLREEGAQGGLRYCVRQSARQQAVDACMARYPHKE